MDISLGYTVILSRVLAAAALGALIGLERDKHGRAAGLRTHLLVSLGSAVFTVISAEIAGRVLSAGYNADPGRIAAQIVTGIGFLGAGVILKTGPSVRGLTTAACLWTAAAVGMAAGAGLYFIAALTTVISLVGLIALKHFERLYAKDSYRTLTVVTPVDISASRIISIVEKGNLSILSCDIARNFTTKTAETRLEIRIYHRGITDKVAHSIIKSIEDSGVELHEVRWSRT